MNQEQADEAFDEIFVEGTWENLPDRRRCPLVNPLCPDDFCVLPAGHVGAAEGWHWLQTSGAAIKVSSAMWLGPKGSTRAHLMQLASARFE